MDQLGANSGRNRDIPNGGGTNSTTVVVDFEGTISNMTSHIDLKIDNGSYTPVTSLHTITGLSARIHTIYVRLEDQEEGVDPSPAQWRFTVIDNNDIVMA
jgi:hypothetical protein